MSNVPLKFSGNLISELSQKIPSSLFALNELIKNAYDAFSPDVVIRISTSDQTIKIIDNGNGMAEGDIESLFHISKSSKNYGQIVRQDGIERIIQGSKGLGFLSAFKFGDKVEWKTSKNGIQSKFSIRKSELIAKEDLSGTTVSITSTPNTTKGTEITVYSNESNIRDLLSDLSNKRVIQKLASSIIDKSFDIKIQIENQQPDISYKKLSCFENENEENQLFYVKYGTDKNEIDFYHKGKHLKSFPFNLERSDYSIELELIIFHFKRGTSSKSISALNRRVHDDALYPLVYVNRNLFNNIVIFDPEIMRKKSSGDSLPQIIGKVHILCQSSEIDFNSDRTNFVETSLTRALLKDLEELNKQIQVNGAELKKKLKSNNKIPTGKAIPQNTSEAKSEVATININRRKPTTFYIPSEQINLEDYLYQVKNSDGETVKPSDIEIKINGENSNRRIIPSIEEKCEKSIVFRYNDPVTGLVSTEFILSFEKKYSNISGKTSESESLFKIESNSGYTVKIDTVSEIINAVDKAYSSRSKLEFLSLIACSLRAIFEISSEKIHKKHSSLFTNFDNKKFSKNAKNEIKDSLLLDVIHVVILMKKNQKLVSLITEELDTSYKTFNNLLNIIEFKSAVKISHVGAHKSTKSLTKPKIEFCASICGQFAVICDIISNSNSLPDNIQKVTETDINNYMTNL